MAAKSKRTHTEKFFAFLSIILGPTMVPLPWAPVNVNGVCVATLSTAELALGLLGKERRPRRCAIGATGGGAVDRRRPQATRRVDANQRTRANARGHTHSYKRLFLHSSRRIAPAANQR